MFRAHLIFVAPRADENILTTKISRSTVSEVVFAFNGLAIVSDSMVTLSVLDPLTHSTGLTPENQKTIKLLNFDSTQIDLSKLAAT